MSGVGVDIKVLNKWMTRRDNTITSLRNLANDIDDMNKNIKKVGTMSSAASVVGGVAAIGSAVFSGGLSLVGLAITASVSGAAGTYAVEKMDSELEKMAKEQTEEVIEKDHESRQEIVRFLDILKRTEEDVLAVLLQEEALASDDFEDECQFHSDVYEEENTSVDKKAKPDITIPFHKVRLISLMNCGTKLAGTVVHNASNAFKAGSGASANAVQAGSTFAKVGRVAKFSILVNAVLLPLDIGEFMRNRKALNEGAIHNVSKQIRNLAYQLQQEQKTVAEQIRTAVTDVVRFSALLKDMQAHPVGREAVVFRKMAEVVETILPLVGLSYQSMNRHNDKKIQDKDNTGLGSSVLVLKTDGLSGSTYQQLSTWLWCSLHMGKSSVALILNTHFTEAPALWNLFGKSFNTYCTNDSPGGVSVLIPKNFGGTVFDNPGSIHRLHRAYNDRFLALKVRINNLEMSLIAVAAPEFVGYGFSETIKAFITRHATGNHIIASNSQQCVEGILTRRQIDSGISLGHDGLFVFISSSLIGSISKLGFDSLLKTHNVVPTRAITLFI